MARKNLFNFRYMSKLFSISNEKPLTVWKTRKLCSYRAVNPVSTSRIDTLRWYSETKAPWVTSELKNPLNPDPIPPVVENPPEDEDERKRRDDAWRKMKYSLLALGSLMGICGGTVVYTLGKPRIDEEGNIIRDEFSSSPIVFQYIKRMLKELEFYSKMIKEPSRDKLLPDPLKYPYMQPPFTLVLELKDLLVHPEWTYQTGWRFKKRPGVDKFLEQCGPPNFEIVVFTAEQGMTAFPILDSLDPNGFIMYRLVRDATDFVDGHHVKNLDCLNRDLSKVIVVDWDENSVKLHGNNAFLIPRWNGNDDDTTLVDLAAFLKTVVASNIEDVRDVLTYYRSFDNPIEAFRENQRKLLEQLEEQERQSSEKRKNQPLTSRWSSTLLNRK